jgi:ornithine carbamoyltransferase
MPRHFVSQTDLHAEEIWDVFERAKALKRDRYSPQLLGRTLVMFFEKASTRTRLSFEVGMAQLGGQAIYVDAQSSQLSRGESIADTARVVSRYADLIMARVNQHQTVMRLAQSAGVPVINGLSDEEHPCQTMSDFFTIWERLGKVNGVSIAYVGDGDNNVTHSLLIAAAQLGAHITVGCPASLAPQSRYVALAEKMARDTGGSVTVTRDAIRAVDAAEVVYTDVWVSMGREAEKERRIELLRPFQVNAELVARANPDFLFMHCLPAHIEEEVTADVAYGPHSVIFDEAENRLHVQKALMLFLLDQRDPGGR